MILAGAIFACLIGIIYLLWNQRTLQKQVDNLENSIASLSSPHAISSGMPPLDEVIAHYEQQLAQEDDGVEAEAEEAEDDHVEPESLHIEDSGLDVIAEEEGEGEGDDVADDVVATPETKVETKIIDLSGDSKPTVNMSKFNSIKAKDFKEKCKELGFSPKGPKQELIIRLLKHPSFDTEEDLVAAMTQTGTEVEPEPKAEEDHLTIVEQAP